MNKRLSDAGKQILKDLLVQITSDQLKFFKNIYFHNNENITIDEMCLIFKDEHLDNAISLCERTLNKKQIV